MDGEKLKARLLAPHMPDEPEPVEIPGMGTVKVRPLSRAEVLRIEKTCKTSAQIEQASLALAMVEPTMTEAEVAQWQKASPGGEITRVALKVAQISGMLEAVDAKAIYKSDGD